MTRASFILAADGGGTRCRVLLTDGSMTYEAETGPANVSTDFDAAREALLQAMRLAAERAGLSLLDLAEVPAYLGLAGVTGPELSARMEEALPLRYLRIEEDRHAALQGALGGRDGLLLHCGTGSFGGVRIGGVARFAGGWGAALGDEASAGWAGKRILALSLGAADGLREETGLSLRIKTRFGGPDGIIAFAGRAGPDEIGALAPEVAAAAGEGDALALQVMREGADYLSTLAEGLGWTPGMPLILAGGFGPGYAGYLPEAMQRGLAPPLGAPIDGAVALARAFAAEVAMAGRAHG